MRMTYSQGRVALALAQIIAGACAAESSRIDELGTEESPEQEEVGAVSQAIRNATPVPPGQLLAMVRVSSSHGNCSGVVIAPDTVLTAAHCLCTDNLIGGNVCTTVATVRFQNHPSSGASGGSLSGDVTIHPDYDPALTSKQNDLAIIKLNGAAPSYIAPFPVANSTPVGGTGARVRVVGYGSTGSDCSGPSGLNYAVARIDGYEDGSNIMRFNDPVVCPGDSGGAVLHISTNVLHGVHSSITSTVTHGSVSKATTTSEYYDWIKSQTCASGFWDRCSGKATMCRCRAGIGDCDSDADCERLLECRLNVGSAFGYAADADVCVAPGPVEGTCTCQNSGAGNICTASNGCSAGYVPVCERRIGTPQDGCGDCTCQ